MNFIKKHKLASFLSALFIVAIVSVAAFQDKQVYLVNDSSLADNDTIVSGWVNIGSAPNVSIGLQVLDSVWCRSEIFYRYGTSGQRLQLAVTDTLSTPNHTASATTSFGKYAGKDLRGYGLTTDLIPGANYIYIKTTVVNDNTGDHGTGSSSENVKVSLMTSD